ncbi:Uncharacterised protein [uncultured archaeon]|nr:Uncharacterised protein [uncultured archaeon]
MVALAFDPLYYSLLVLFSAIVPGTAVGWPFLKKTGLSVLEKLLICFFVGLTVVPALLAIEGMAGIGFSLYLVFANLLAVSAAGIFYGIRSGAFGLKLPEIDLDAVLDLEFAKKHAATALLLLAVLLSFWLRIQTYSPIYSELDPYFYVYGTGQIIRDGAVPMTDDTAWWPEIKTSGHRGFPSLKMYIEAQWYALYTSGGEYSNYLLFTTSSWLPPIAAALMAFGAYLLFSAYYGKRYGILAAFLMALLPISIFKMSAGVNEAAPFGMMSIFLAIGVAAIALKKSDAKLAAVGALVFFAAATGSNYEPVLAMPLAGFIALQALDYFARGKESRDFLKLSAILSAGFLAGIAGDAIYNVGIAGILNAFSDGSTLAILGALAFALCLHHLHGMGLKEKRRNGLLAGGAVLAVLLLLVPNPIGAVAKAQVKNYIGAADFNFPLQRTIAEQNQAGGNFEGEAGFLALVPASHYDASAKGLAGMGMNAFYGALGLLSAPFSALGNAALQVSTAFFNFFLGTYITTGAKDDSLLFFFMAVSAAGMAVNHFARQGEDRDRASIAILLLLLILPIAYVGLNKIKYTVFVGLALVVAGVAAIAELEKLFLWIAARMKSKEGEKYVKLSFVALIALFAVAEAFVPSNYSVVILSKSFEPRYQDNPAAMMPKLANTCESLRAIGYFDSDICSAGYNISYADTINGQFNSKVCLVSQLSMKELIPGNSTAEQQASSEAKAGASFRCNRIADYWIDSMEWINRNLDPGDRVTSWWDYGHWTNYFGDRKTVLRNEHVSKGMIGRVAHDYIDGTTQQLADSMNYFDSRYVLFDVELVGGGSFGGKYGALNYLSCAHDNETTVLTAPGSSDCEFEHLWETIAIPKAQTPSTACTISESQQRTGVTAFRMGKGMVPESTPSYCVGGELTLPNGETITPMYRKDSKHANGDLALQRGFLRNIGEQGDASFFEVIYTGDAVWPDGKGGYSGGLEDATTKFYSSNLYKGFYLKDLPGFELAYESRGGEVKIYRLKNFTGNKEGYVDPVTAAMTQ